MSKMAAVHTAISLQLATDGKNDVGMKETLAAVTPAPAYDANSLPLFLAKVAFRLRIDTPSLVFNWQAVNATQALTWQRWTLEETIAQNTQPAPSDAKPADAKAPAA
jgi:hypothetical protein